MTFCFDLAHPGTYLAAERVERLRGPVAWQPASAPALLRADPADVEARAQLLRLPLVWPERPLEPVPRAQRAAAYAAERGRGAAFALAASRLAWCGGFDLDDLEILAEAAAAAGLDLEPCLAAAADPRRDEPIARVGAFLADHGADTLPVVRVGRLLFAGEIRVGDAAAALRRPAAPLGWARARE